MSKLTDLVADIKSEFPTFRLVKKEESKLSKFLAILLRPFCPEFLTRFGTTIGKTVYYPGKWNEETLYEVLRHERVHMRDSDRWGPLYYLTYLLLPLPIIVSGRAYWEFRGYCETLKVTWENWGKPRDFRGLPLVDTMTVEFVLNQFTGMNYLFMFPFEKALREAFHRASLKWT